MIEQWKTHTWKKSAVGYGCAVVGCGCRVEMVSLAFLNGE
jgi:hypothetical protein